MNALKPSPEGMEEANNPFPIILCYTAIVCGAGRIVFHLLPVFIVRLGRQPLLRSVVFLFRPDLGKNNVPTRRGPLTYVPPYCLSSVFGEPSASRYRPRYSDDAGNDFDVEGLHVIDQVNT